MLDHELETLSFWRLKLRPVSEVLYEFINERLISSLREFALIIKQAE